MNERMPPLTVIGEGWRFLFDLLLQILKQG